MTSRDLVNVVQRRLRKIKVGHAGTLDPLAEGVLVLGIGSASRLIPYLQQLPKRYHATFRLGCHSETGDLEGELHELPDPPRPEAEQLAAAAERFIGCVEQRPPAYSAIWVDGQRAYKLARAGKEVEIPLRKVQIDSLNITRYDYPEFEFETVCGSGTYIRSLGIDLAAAVGSTAVMTHLQRRAVGPFTSDDAVSIEQLREDDLSHFLQPPEVGVQHLKRLPIDGDQGRRLGHGQPIELPREDQEEAAAMQDGKLRAIVRWKRHAWWPYRVFETK